MPITAKNFGSIQPKVNTWKDMLHDIANGDFDKVYELTPRGIADGTFICTCCSDDNVFIRVSRVNTEEGIAHKIKAYTVEADLDGHIRTTQRPAIMSELENEFNDVFIKAMDNVAVGIAEFAGKQELAAGDIKLDIERSKLIVNGIGEFTVFMNEDDWSFRLSSPSAAGKAYLEAKSTELQQETMKQLFPLMFQNQYAYIAETLDKNRGIAGGYFTNDAELQQTIDMLKTMAEHGDFHAYCMQVGPEKAMNTLMKASNALTEVKDYNYPSQPFGIQPHKIDLCVGCIDALVDLVFQSQLEAPRQSIDALIADADSTVTSNPSFPGKQHGLDR